MLLLLACASPTLPPPLDTAPTTAVCDGLPCDALPPLPAEQPCGAALRAQLDAGEAPTWPEALSGLGCFGDPGALDPLPGVLRYEVTAPLFSEGADKARWLVLPPGTTITPAADAEWGFPRGALLLKAFSLPEEGHPIEVRAMLRTDAGWAFASWAWADGDLSLVPERGAHTVVQLPAGPQPWLFPSLLSCELCHRVPGGQVLGLSTRQLHRRVDYGHVRADQLTAFDGVGLFSPPITALPDLPVLADPYRAAPVADRARAWLHANCAHCHQPGGFAPPDQALDLRASTPLAEASLCMAPKHAGYTTPGDHLLVPGDPAASHLVQRLRTPSFEKMPPDGGIRYDEPGIAAVEQWIRELAACP
jgi:hypothetical protein